MTSMSRYETEQIPPSDLYSSTPLYGRYTPRPGDLTPDSLPPAALYTLVVRPENSLIPDPEYTGRKIYALGHVIVKGQHVEKGQVISHKMGDMNDVAAIKLVRDRFPTIRVPEIYFQGEV
jgi:hypothetical protein